MATTQDYMEYVCERLPECGDVRYRRMFGEYMVYVNDKPLLTVCDNTVFVKKLPELVALLADAAVGCPYEGAEELLGRTRSYLVWLPPETRSVLPLSETSVTSLSSRVQFAGV